VDVLRGRGFGDVIVEAGGDLVAGGVRGDGTPWRIGIRAPRPGLALTARFEAANRAVATSGDYMQPFTDDYSQHHILDPRRGYSSPELASATVAAPTAALADALATLTMVLGPRRGRALIEDLPDCEAYFIAKDLEVTRTSGFTVL
jgi:thiamine biosynthesis lipoprotein